MLDWRYHGLGQLNEKKTSLHNLTSIALREKARPQLHR
jgi:hypothetical protein